MKRLLLVKFCLLLVSTTSAYAETVTLRDRLKQAFESFTEVSFPQCFSKEALDDLRDLSNDASKEGMSKILELAEASNAPTNSEDILGAMEEGRTRPAPEYNPDKKACIARAVTENGKIPILYLYQFIEGVEGKSVYIEYMEIMDASYDYLNGLEFDETDQLESVIADDVSNETIETVSIDDHYNAISGQVGHSMRAEQIFNELMVDDFHSFMTNEATINACQSMSYSDPDLINQEYLDYAKLVADLERMKLQKRALCHGLKDQRTFREYYEASLEGFNGTEDSEIIYSMFFASDEASTEIKKQVAERCNKFSKSAYQIADKMGQMPPINEDTCEFIYEE